MEYTNELYLDVAVEGKNHRIDIKHADTPCDGEIIVDEQKVNFRLKTLKNGGAYIFHINETEVIITIENNNKDFSYDCFVNGESLQTGMPWKVEKMDYPTMTRWASTNKGGKVKYIITETLKGAIIGCLLFFILYFIDKFTTINIFTISWKFLAITVCPLALLYLILAPIDFNKNKKRFEVFESYLNKK